MDQIEHNAHWIREHFPNAVYFFFHHFDAENWAKFEGLLDALKSVENNAIICIDLTSARGINTVTKNDGYLICTIRFQLANDGL